MPNLGRCSSIEQDTASSTEPSTPSSVSSPIDRSALLLAYLVPSNRPARSAILRAREEGSTYHANFITEIKHRGCPNTPCFELALGGLPGVSWRIGRGCNKLKDKGVDLLLVTDDDGIASVHASFGWTIHKPDLLLIIVNEQHKACTINGREFCFGDQTIPSENTILIGDCAFTLLFTPRTGAAEALFQTESRKHVLRLLELRGRENTESVVVAPKKNLKRSCGVNDGKNLQEIQDDEEDIRSYKRVNYGD
jgi:hypothetical protein